MHGPAPLRSLCSVGTFRLLYRCSSLRHPRGWYAFVCLEDITDKYAEKRLWEQTLTYLSSRSESPTSSEDEKLRQMIAHYASRVSTSPTSSGQALLSNDSSLHRSEQQSSQQAAARIQFLTQQNQSLSDQVQALLQQLEQKKELTVSLPPALSRSQAKIERLEVPLRLFSTLYYWRCGLFSLESLQLHSP
jgi:hypothetical protein